MKIHEAQRHLMVVLGDYLDNNIVSDEDAQEKLRAAWSKCVPLSIVEDFRDWAYNTRKYADDMHVNNEINKDWHQGMLETLDLLEGYIMRMERDDS